MVVHGLARIVCRPALVVMLAIGCLLAVPGFADPCEFPAEILSQPGGGDATPVEVGIFVLDLMEIDDVAQGYVADLLVRAVWKDSRLANANDTICIVTSDAITTFLSISS